MGKNKKKPAASPSVDSPAAGAAAAAVDASAGTMASLDVLLARARAANIPEPLIGAITDAVASGKVTAEAAGAMIVSQLDSYESPRGAFTNGDVACVHGLNGRPDLNAEHCVLTAFNDDAARWAVRFTSGEEVRLKAANLKHPTAPPSPETLAKLASGGESAPTSHRSGRDRQMKGKQEEAAPESLDWRMNHIDANQVEKGVAQCLSTLDALKRKPAEAQWLIFARRSKCWMGEGAQKRRMWFITIARSPNVAHCFVCDGPLLADIQAASTRIPSNSIVLGCVAALMVELGVRPATVMVPPLGVPCFRPRCAHELSDALAAVLHHGPGAILEVKKIQCGEVPEDVPSSVLGLALGREFKPGGPEPVFMGFMSLIEQQLEAMEESISARNGTGMSERLGGLHESSRLAHLPGNGVNTTCSVTTLRELFAATERFHEAAPWDILANQQFLHLKNEATGEEAWAMVCGHTDYAGRGLNLYSNKRDLQNAHTGGPGVRCTGWMNRLQFVDPDMASFSVLDDIANLRLPLATNDPTGEVVPCWYRRMKPEGPTSVEAIVETWDNPPPHESWPFLAAAARAIALFARDPSLCVRPPGFSSIEITVTPAKLAGLIVTGGSLDGPGSKMAGDAELATMSIGATDKCNFCNKPAASSPAGQLLPKCRGCSIRYCSERCRMIDLPRHEAACSA